MAAIVKYNRFDDDSMTLRHKKYKNDDDLLNEDSKQST